MKFRLFGLLTLLFAVVLTLCNQPGASRSQTTKATLSQAEQDLLSEINKARAEPQVYAGYLENLKPQFKGKLYTPAGMAGGLETQEGWDAVADAINFMKTLKPAPPLNGSEGLRLAAFSHVKEQSTSGATGHAGADKMLIEERVKPFGAWQGDIGENLSYGNESARERLLTWLIDDGFKSRGHRRRLMSQDYKVAGISCGPHPQYGGMCVLALAGGFTDTGAKTQAATSDKSGSSLKNQQPTATLSAEPAKNSNANATKSSNGSTNANTQKIPRKY